MDFQLNGYLTGLYGKSWVLLEMLENPLYRAQYSAF